MTTTLDLLDRYLQQRVSSTLARLPRGSNAAELAEWAGVPVRSAEGALAALAKQGRVHTVAGMDEREVRWALRSASDDGERLQA